MEIIAECSFKNGKEFILRNHGNELKEIIDVISLIDASACRTKKSKEKTMKGKMLFSPIDLNKRFFELFEEKWKRTIGKY